MTPESLPKTNNKNVQGMNHKSYTLSTGYAQGGARVPGQAGELGARNELAGGAVLLGSRVREHGRVLKQRDALGHAGRGKHGAVAVEIDAGQDGRRLARARARQLRDHLRTADV